MRASEETLAAYKELQQKKRRARSEIEARVGDESVTSDGRKITLSANIEFAEELPQVKSSGARGIGLYRTEFHYLGSSGWPSEDESYGTYHGIASAVGGREDRNGEPNRSIRKSSNTGENPAMMTLPNASSCTPNVATALAKSSI